MRNYDDIRHLQRPQYEDLPPMSRHDRAAQFSPFAALVGYDAAVAETERLTERRRELSEEEIRDINIQLAGLMERIVSRPFLKVTYFVPDERKSGGRYEEKEGNLRSIDQYNRHLVFTDETRIPIDAVCSIYSR